MTLWEIFRFEIGCQARRVSTWLYFAVLLTVSVYPSLELSADYARADGSFANAPFIVAVLSLLCSMMGLLVASALAGEAAARDAQTRMDPLVYTAPVGKAAYLGGRFLAAFGLYAVILLAVPIGFGLDELVLSRTALGGPFRLEAYLGAYGFLLLPNAFIATALMFSMAALTRRAVVSYFAGVLLVGACAFNWTVVAGTWGRWELAKLMDPFGATILGELSMVWTAAERSTRSIDLQGALLWNRVLWIGIAAGVLALTHRRFRFAHYTARPAWRRDAGRADHTARGGVTVIPAPEVQRAFGFTTHARQTLALARESFHAIVRRWGGVILVATAAFLVFSATPAPFMGIPLVPTTERIITFLAAPLASPQEINWIVVPLLIVFCAGELIWREREARVSEITDAIPVPDWVPFLGTFVGLSLVLVALQALVMAGGMLTQVLLGYSDFEIALYAQTLFGLQLADYLLFALLALVLHMLVNHKYLGHLAGVFAYAFMAYGPAVGIEHNLLLYGSDPGWSYSDMRGFEPFIGAWLWFKLYWTAWALLLLVTATLFRVRGTETNLPSRIELARRRFTPRTRGAAAAAAALILATGGFIFYNTNVLNAYAPTADGLARRADYERRYGQYRNVPQPQLTGTNLRVEIYPDRRQVEIRGVFQLVNATLAGIDTIHLATKAAVDTTGIRFDRPAKEVLADDRLGHRMYALATPLRPGDSLRLEFEVRFTPRGFSNRGIDAAVVPNGTYFTNGAWLPSIGYQAERELGSAGERRAHGLPVRPMMPALDDGAARFDPERSARVAFEAVVATDDAQIALAPGRLRRSWTENGRRYFHYATDVPIRNDYAFFSAAYAVREARWRGAAGSGSDVSIEIFHHPAHAWNVDRMVRSVQASLDYYTKMLGPYPHGQVRFVERAGDSVTLHASPVNIWYEEPFALLNPDGDPRNIDHPFAVVAHEVAHQWWGDTLTPAGVEGAGLLTETLAWYSAFGVVEQALGREHLQRLLGMMREVYLRPASRANVPLLRADDRFLAVRKGPFAMYALREYVGAERVDGALRRLLERHGSGIPPLPTSLDLYRELQAVTPESLHRLLVDLFEANTFWELATHNVTAEQTDAVRWQVTLDVQVRKVVVDEDGAETEVAMDDLIEVGVFAGAEIQGLGDTLYLDKHRVRSGRQRITVTVPSKPARAGIDPRSLLIDVRADDNLEEVARAEALAPRGR